MLIQELTKPVKLGRNLYEKVLLHAGTYAKGRGVALWLEAEYDNYWEHLVTVTVSVPADPRTGRKVWVRNTEENEGVLEAMEKAKVLKRTGVTRRQGFITVFEAEIAEHIWEQIEEEGVLA